MYETWVDRHSIHSLLNIIEYLPLKSKTYVDLITTM